MAESYEILNARVKQKVTTEQKWLEQEDEFGVILEGEQAFVVNEDNNPVNFKIGDGTKKFSELPYFIAYYSDVVNNRTAWFLNQNTDLEVSGVFKNYSCLFDLIIINESGQDINLRAGTTFGGNELFDVIIDQGAKSINVRKVFSNNATLYLSGLAGKNYSLILVYYQYDLAPAVLPESTVTRFRWPKGHKGMYEPIDEGDLDTMWDFTTGRGREGTAFENCAISGTNGTEEMGRFYPVGWQVGDSLLPATVFGNERSTLQLEEKYIPKIQLKIASGAAPVDNLINKPDGTIAWTSNKKNGNQDYDLKYANDNNASLGKTSSYGRDVPEEIDLRPQSKVCLFYVAITD